MQSHASHSIPRDNSDDLQEQQQQQQQQRIVTVEELPNLHLNETQPAVLTLEHDQSRINPIMYTVATTSVVEEQAPPTAEQGGKSNNCLFGVGNNNRKRQWIFLAVVMVLSATVLIVSLTMNAVGNNNKTYSSSGTALDQDQDFEYYRDRFVVLRTALSNYSKPYLFYNPDSPQSKALQWLVFIDKTLPPIDQILSSDFNFRLTQRYAYLVLYFSCGGKEWFTVSEKNNNMQHQQQQGQDESSFDFMKQQMANVHECAQDFLGVTACNEQGQITALHLAREDMVGQLPIEMGLLTNLKRLDLSYNNLVGSIPSVIGKLTNLESLKLEYNNFRGLLDKHTIGPLKHLQIFNVAGNRLTGPLPLDAMKEWKDMVSIDVGFNHNLSGPLVELAVAVPWSNLTGMYLTKTSINGTIPSNIDQALPWLQSFWAGVTSIQGTLPESIGNLVHLKRFFLGSEYVSNATIPTSISKLAELRDVGFRGKGFQGTIPTQLGFLTNINFILIGDSNMRGSIPTEFGRLTDLLVLDMMGTPLTGTIPSQLSNLHKLRKLLLWKTELVGTLQDEFCEMKSLGQFQYPCGVTCPCCTFDCRQSYKGADN